MFNIKITFCDGENKRIRGNIEIECNLVKLYPENGGYHAFPLLDIEFVSIHPVKEGD